MKQLAALPLVLAAGVLAGCPDTSVSPPGSGGGSAGPVGRVKLIQTLVSAADPDADNLNNFVVSPNGKKVYAGSWAGGKVLSFDRSPLDGSLARAYASRVINAYGMAITPDGEHLYATGSNQPNQIVPFDIDAVTGEPTPKANANVLTPTGSEVAIAAGGTLLFKSEGGFTGSYIQAYRIDPTSGALTAGAKTLHDSPHMGSAFLADDEHGTLYVERSTGDTTPNTAPKFIDRYSVDPVAGALTIEAEMSADLWNGYSRLARCEGTTRLYVPQEAGNIGYADISGTGLFLSSTFTHPDLGHVYFITLSPDCQNLYAVTQESYSGSLVVLARDAAGDLTWLQTILMGPNTAVPAITRPSDVVVSPDGKNVYVDSLGTGEGFAVFQRDATGEGFP
jgi:6-phosphogluconolactonase (cycloisomerase 2 family)